MLNSYERDDELSNLNILLKKMFGRYLSQEVMDSIIADPKSPSLEELSAKYQS